MPTNKQAYPRASGVHRTPWTLEPEVSLPQSENSKRVQFFTMRVKLGTYSNGRLGGWMVGRFVTGILYPRPRPEFGVLLRDTNSGYPIPNSGWPIMIDGDDRSRPEFGMVPTLTDEALLIHRYAEVGGIQR